MSDHPSPSRAPSERAINIATAVLLIVSVGVIGRHGVANAITSFRDGRRLAAAQALVNDSWESIASTGNALRSRPPEGNTLAGAQLVIFSDYECPYCRRLDETLTRMEADGSLPPTRFRHFPLRIHRNARWAATAAICAAQQGRFWQAHQYLMTTTEWQQHPDDSLFVSRAGVTDVTAFHQCTTSDLPRNILTADSLMAFRLGLTGTPLVVGRGAMRTGALADSELKALAAGR